MTELYKFLIWKQHYYYLDITWNPWLRVFQEGFKCVSIVDYFEGEDRFSDSQKFDWLKYVLDFDDICVRYMKDLVHI